LQYLGLESVFSSGNYWVNMQVCYAGLKGISFDLGDNSRWEFVLLDHTQTGVVPQRQTEGKEANGNVSDDDDEEKANNEVVDLPPSWVDRLKVTKEQFESRSPSGSKTSLYKDARWEIFAEYNRQDGMVSRITMLEEDSNSTDYIREVYGNRRSFIPYVRDKLSERIRTPRDHKIHESFNPGRVHGLKEHIMVNGITKEMQFYATARSDGLVRRVDTPKKVSLSDKGYAFLCGPRRQARLP
jgi:hypothetical protein